MSEVIKINQGESLYDELSERWNGLMAGLNGYIYNVRAVEPDYLRREFTSKDGRVVAVTVRIMRRDARSDGMWMDISYSGYSAISMSDVVDVDVWISTAKAILDAFGVEKVQ